MQDIELLFEARNILLASVYGTAMAAGLGGYHAHFGKYPNDTDKMYSQFVRKLSDRDPFDTGFLPFKYRVVDRQFAVDTPAGRLFLEQGDSILYSKGFNNEDDRGAEHSLDGTAGDIVLWPPVRAILRKDGQMD
jgi:hypothetical protein